MQIDPFFQVPQHPISTSVGQVQLPVLLKEGDYCVSLFMVDRSKLKTDLAPLGMKPAWVLGKKAIVVLVMADFTVCSVSPYRMISLSYPVVRQQGFQPVSPWREVFSEADERHMGFYLASSHVDSVYMSKVGSEVWGHPKSHANIDYDLNGKHIHCTATCSASGDNIMRFSGKGTRFFRIPSLNYTMFSVLKKQVKRALLNTRGMYDVHIPMGFKLEIGNAQHLMSQQMANIGLNGKRPLIVLSTKQFQGRYHEGTVVEEIDTPLSEPNESVASSAPRSKQHSIYF